jgi:hypothetical protein
MVLTGEDQSTGEKKSPSANLSTTKLTLTVLGLNPNPCSDCSVESG